MHTKKNLTHKQWLANHREYLAHTFKKQCYFYASLYLPNNYWNEIREYYTKRRKLKELSSEMHDFVSYIQTNADEIKKLAQHEFDIDAEPVYKCIIDYAVELAIIEHKQNLESIE